MRCPVLGLDFARMNTGRGYCRRNGLKQGFLLTLTGIAFGIAGSTSLTGLLRNLLYGIQPGDPFIFFSMALLPLLVGRLACYIPARRATGIDPVRVLHYE